MSFDEVRSPNKINSEHSPGKHNVQTPNHPRVTFGAPDLFDNQIVVRCAQHAPCTEHAPSIQLVSHVGVCPGGAVRGSAGGVLPRPAARADLNTETT